MAEIHPTRFSYQVITFKSKKSSTVTVYDVIYITRIEDSILCERETGAHFSRAVKINVNRVQNTEIG